MLVILLAHAVITQAAGRNGGTGEPGAADYCTVALAPKLADELKLDVVQRVRVALVGDTLMPRVKNALSNYLSQPGNRQTLQRDTTPGETLMIRALDYSGTSVLEVLTPEQKRAFDALRSSGKVAPVKVRFIGPVPASGPVLFEVLFTAFGETAKAEDPVKETTTQENGKTVTHTDAQIKETRGDAKALAAIKTASDALQVLAFDDEKVWRVGATWLLKAGVDDSNRAAVLAALKTRVTGATSGGLDRLKRSREVAMEALSKWADRSATPALQEILHLPRDYHECVAAALRALIRVDPDAAEAAIREQGGDFFFRNTAKQALQSLTDADGVSKEEIAKLQALVNGEQQGLMHSQTPESNGSKPTASGDDLTGLIADVKSGELHRQVPAMMKLTRMKPEAPNAEVSAALSGVLQDAKGVPLRVNAAKALETWGTAESLPALKKAAEDSNPTLQARARQAIEKISAAK